MTNTYRTARRAAPLGVLLMGWLWVALWVPPAAADGEIVQVNPDGTVSREKIYGFIKNQYVDCYTTALCTPCGICHATTNKNYDARKHESTYFPRFTQTVRSGERLAWGGGRTLTSDGKSLCVTDARGAKQCYPLAGTWVLKDKGGKPAALFSNSAPRKP